MISFGKVLVGLNDGVPFSVAAIRNGTDEEHKSLGAVEALHYHLRGLNVPHRTIEGHYGKDGELRVETIVFVDNDVAQSSRDRGE